MHSKKRNAKGNCPQKGQPWSEDRKLLYKTKKTCRGLITPALLHCSTALASSKAELLDRGLSGVQAGSDDTDGGEHGDPAIVELPSTHLR